VKILLNQIEELSASLRNARAEIQQLRDENNRLKGEQGKPKIKANVPQSAAKHSSNCTAPPTMKMVISKMVSSFRV